MSQITFNRIGQSGLFTAESGDARNRIIFVRSTGSLDLSLERVPNTNIILIGGEATKKQLTDLLTEYGRPTVNEMIQGGITGRTYTNLRTFLKIRERANHHLPAH